MGLSAVFLSLTALVQMLVICLALDGVWKDWLAHNASGSLRTLSRTGQKVLAGGVIHGGVEQLLSGGNMDMSDKVIPSPWDIGQNFGHLVDSYAKEAHTLLVDPFGFEFLLESLTVFPNANVVLVVQEPNIFLAAARNDRLAYCSEPFLFSNAKMNAKRGRFEEKWLAAFGTACPSDFQLLKQYHIKNILARLVAAQRSVPLSVIDVGTGQGVSQACSVYSASLGQWSACEHIDATKPTLPSSNSYASQLAAVDSVEKAHALYWRLIRADLVTLTFWGTRPAADHDSLVSAMAGAAQRCSNDVPVIVGAGLSKTGTTSMMTTLAGWNISAGHWLECKNLYRVVEWEAAWMVQADTQGRKARDGLRFFNSITRNLEALSDLPVPNLLTEVLLLRPAAVIVYTQRNPTSWARSFGAWLGKSCRSHDFKGCSLSGAHASVVEDRGIRRILEAPVCPAGVLAFGVTCPSQAQAAKRYLLHELTVHFIVPPQSYIVEDVTRATSTKPLCDALKSHLSEPGIGNRLQRSCTLTHGSDTVQYHRRTGPRIADSLECAPGTPYTRTNVNKDLHGGKGVPPRGAGPRKPKPIRRSD